MSASLSTSATAQRVLNTAWLASLALATVAVLVPDPGSGGARVFGHVGGYPADVLQNTYRMIRVVMPWLPAAMLLALVLPPTAIRLLALVAAAAGTILAFISNTGSGSLMLARDLLFVIPGVAAGVWLAERSRLGGVLPVSSTEVPRMAPGVKSIARPDPALVPAAVAGRITEPPDRGGRLQPATLSIRVLGGVLVAAGIVLASGLPRWGLPVAVGLALYSALLWWRPRACLTAIPIALPLFDLAPWTGRIFLDEFDLLIVVSVGMLLLHWQPRARPALARFSVPLIVLFLASATLAAGVGLFPLAPADANAFSSYLSPFNALRVGKGILWGAVFFWMVRHMAPDEATLARSLAIGMGLGLLGVGLVGAWERWLFAGLTDDGSTYRIVSTFSSMHTGGGHIEAYLVAAMPFLWLGLFRLRHLAFIVPVLVLSGYVMLYTVARGGVLAFFVITGILVAATLRTGRDSLLRGKAAPTLALTGVAALVIAGAGSGYLSQRFGQSEEDWGTRVEHWQRSLRILDGSWSAWILGSGLGSFPREYLWHGSAEQNTGTYAFETEQGDTFLRIGVGKKLYVAQRVPVEGGTPYRLTFDVRTREPGAKLAAPLCEKQLLNSRHCDWNQTGVPADGQWHTITHDFPPATVGRGLPWQHIPVELYFLNLGNGGVIDIDRVALLDPQGNNLLGNGDFLRGSDFWFFKTREHLPWHIKNIWVHTIFEMGLAGLLATALLVMAAAARLARAGWNGSRLAWVFLASLAGLLTVGMFDSLIDTPRLATLFVAWLFIGSGLAWPRQTDVG